jgi:hypothetical protein
MAPQNISSCEKNESLAAEEDGVHGENVSGSTSVVVVSPALLSRRYKGVPYVGAWKEPSGKVLYGCKPCGVLTSEMWRYVYVYICTHARTM